MSFQWLCVPQVTVIARNAVVFAALAVSAADVAAQSNAQAAFRPDSSQGQAQATAAATPACLQGTDFCMKPTLNTQNNDPTGKCIKQFIPQNQPGFLFCVNPLTGALIPGCTVHVSVAARDQTGGHLHTDPGRDGGSFSPDSGVTITDPSDPNFGLLPTTYTAPEVSGIMDATVTGTLPDGTAAFPTATTIGIETPGLASLPASGDGYASETSVGHDSNNLSVNPSVENRLLLLPEQFNIYVQVLIGGGYISGGVVVPTLVYKSISLPFGGLFDVDSRGVGAIDNPWSPPHCAHRRGVDVDIALVPPQYRRALTQAIVDEQFRFPSDSESPNFPNATHWHITSR